MNNKKKLTKSISVALLVALAAIATTGLVLADHYPPVGDVAVSSLISFEQYQAAIDHMEEDRTAALTALSVSKVNSLDVFTQYSEAMKQMRQEQAARLFTALESKSDESMLRWEQYLKYAK